MSTEAVFTMKLEPGLRAQFMGDAANRLAPKAMAAA